MKDDIFFFQNLLVNFGKVVTFLLFIPILVAFFKRQYLEKPFKLAAIFLLLIIVVNLFEQGLIWHVGKYYMTFWKPIFDKWKITDTNFLNIISRSIDFLFVGWTFSFAFDKPISIYLRKSAFVLVPLAIIIYLFVDGFRSYGNTNAIINRLFLISIPLLYFWKVAKEPMAVSIWKNPFFLFAIGLFLPNLFSFYMSFFGDKLNETDFPMFVKLSVVRNVFTIIGQIFFALAFYRAGYAKYLINK